jgi:hypothetical protein
MKKLLIILILILIAGGAILFWHYWINQPTPEVSNSLFSITALCNGQKECVYQDQDLGINVIITNISEEPISLPMEFLQKQGPNITLTSTDTEQTFTLPTQLADPQLLTNLTTIPANQTARLSWVVHPEEIKQIGGDVSNVIGQVTITTTVEHAGQTMQASSSSNFTITH